MFLDFEEFLFGAFMFLFLGALTLGLIVGVIEGTQAIRARSAVFACESRNLRAVRKTFSTTVACTPRNMGSDTLNVKPVS